MRASRAIPSLITSRLNVRPSPVRSEGMKLMITSARFAPARTTFWKFGMCFSSSIVTFAK